MSKTMLLSSTEPVTIANHRFFPTAQRAWHHSFSRDDSEFRNIALKLLHTPLVELHCACEDR